jgi:hypothetical protein
MQFNDTVNAEGTRLARTRTPLLRRAIPVATAASLVVTLALTFPRSVTADDDGQHPGCGNATLQGDYGLLVSGIRGAGPGLTESFVGTGLHTYDGHGGLTGIDSTHGQLTGADLNRPVTGTYEVNADCTGTATLFIPGAPFPVRTSFVIVDKGREVTEAVMSPQPNLVTAVLRRIR